ncbi:MAG TPA: preprotein translocase subunit YajC [Terriglobales bacterium]|nr:preprotein translocase subunit YajC [Terriglobales bacterium]
MYVPSMAVAMNDPTLFLAQASSGSSLIGLLPLVFIFVIFYLLLIRPQQKRQKEWAAKLETLKSGDRIVTSGGIKGTIIAVKDDSFHLRVPPDNLRLEVVKSAVVSVAVEEKVG